MENIIFNPDIWGKYGIVGVSLLVIFMWVFIVTKALIRWGDILAEKVCESRFLPASLHESCKRRREVLKNDTEGS